MALCKDDNIPDGNIASSLVSVCSCAAGSFPLQGSTMKELFGRQLSAFKRLDITNWLNETKVRKDDLCKAAARHGVTNILLLPPQMCEEQVQAG